MEAKVKATTDVFGLTGMSSLKSDAFKRTQISHSATGTEIPKKIYWLFAVISPPDVRGALALVAAYKCLGFWLIEANTRGEQKPHQL